jgi:hypothetical protein
MTTASVHKNLLKQALSLYFRFVGLSERHTCSHFQYHNNWRNLDLYFMIYIQATNRRDQNLPKLKEDTHSMTSLDVQSHRKRETLTIVENKE